MNGLGSFKRKVQGVAMAAMSVVWSGVMLSHAASATETVSQSSLRAELMDQGQASHRYGSQYRLPKAARPYSCHAWARDEQWERAQACIDRVGRIDMKDARGRTLLYWAVLQGNLPEVVTLVGKGANGSIADKRRVSPMRLAKKLARLEGEDGIMGQRMLQVMRSALRPHRQIIAAASSSAEALPQAETHPYLKLLLTKTPSLGAVASEPTHLPRASSGLNLERELMFERPSMGQILYNQPQGVLQRSKPAEESGNSSADGSSSFDYLYLHGPKFSCEGSNDFHC